MGMASPGSSSDRLSSLRLFLDGPRSRHRKSSLRDNQRPVVALVTDAIFPYHRGGKEIRYHELGRRLAGRAEVHVYTMHWWDGPRVRTDEAVTFHAISPLFPMYTQSRRSLKQAIFFALACLRLMAVRFDVLEADH